MIEFLLRRWQRLRQVAPPPVRPRRPPALTPSDPTAAALLATRPRLESILAENILPFWTACVDSECGGYLINHDPAGVYRGPGPKLTIPQARTCWFFSRLLRTRGDPAIHAAAAAGLQLLRERLWDPTGGGFFWSITPGGGPAPDSRKVLMAQSFGLYAVAEYALATGDRESRDFARQIAEVLEHRFGDRVHGGYRGQFSRDWGELPARAAAKTVNEHLHVLEAYTAAFRVLGDAWLRERILELVSILTSTVVRKRYGAVTDAHDECWTPLLDRSQALVSYGHDMESIWLVADACQAVGHPLALTLDWMVTLGELTLRWGWDRRRGGVYFSGPMDGPAIDRRKVWWVQAEVLVGALMTYRLTGDARFGQLYLDTLDWIEGRHLDRAGGDWHAIVLPGGQITGDKSGPWKTPYHNGRAMLQCVELLIPGAVQVQPATGPARGA